MTHGWNKRLATALLCLVGVFGMAAPASAVIVTTSYDPSFDVASPLNGYGWKATVNYEIPASCFTSPGQLKVKVGSLLLGCGVSAISQPFKVLTAEVGIYDVDDSNYLLDVLTFDASTLPLSAICVDQGSLDCAYSVVTRFNPFAIVPKWSNTLAGNALFDDDFNFRMGLIGDAVLEYQYCPAGTSNCSSEWERAPKPTETVSYINTDPNWKVNTALRLGAQTVPEPASLALVLLALGAGFAITRRR